MSKGDFDVDNSIFGQWIQKERDKATAAEKERCLKIAENMADFAPATDREIGYLRAMKDIADAIRGE